MKSCPRCCRDSLSRYGNSFVIPKETSQEGGKKRNKSKDKSKSKSAKKNKSKDKSKEKKRKKKDSNLENDSSNVSNDNSNEDSESEEDNKNDNSDSSSDIIDDSAFFKLPLKDRIKKRKTKIGNSPLPFEELSYGPDAKRSGLDDLSDFDFSFDDKEKIV